MPLDITITPLYRVGGREQASLPGLMAAVPPRQAARGRDQDRLIVDLQLIGKAVLSSGDVIQSASRAAMAFYPTPGTITAALRRAAGIITSSYMIEIVRARGRATTPMLWKNLACRATPTALTAAYESLGIARNARAEDLSPDALFALFRGLRLGD